MSVPVVCEGVAKIFGTAVEAVSPIDLRCDAGRTTALVGPSGCGKSTLLRMMAGLEEPSAGRVLIAGQPPSVTLRKADLAMAFQDPSLLPWRTVRQNIDLVLNLAGRPAKAGEIDRLIRLVGLDGFGDTRPAELSGGMRQRAAIARALATRPALLLLDEPFGAVDELTRQQLAQDLPAIWEARGTTTVLVTHSVSEAVLLSDRVVVLSPRPARTLAEIVIDLPRPRPPSITRDPRFGAHVDQVFEVLSRGPGETLPRAVQ